MSDEEKRIFDKYIRPGRRVLSRIKTWLKIKFKSPRIKTIKDVEYLDYDLFIKLLCITLIFALLRVAFVGILDLYYWVFPRRAPGFIDPYYVIPMLRGLIHV